MSLQQMLCRLLVFAVCVAMAESHGHKKRRQSPSLPLWKSLLANSRKWSGYYTNNQNRVMCSMSVYSVQYDKQGGAHISFVSENDIHIEMMGYSDDNRTVVFKEEHNLNKAGRFEGQTNLVFTGIFMPDTVFYKFEANVSSTESLHYGTVTLIPHDQGSGKSGKGKNDLRLGMAVGIPLFLGIIVMTLAFFILVWAVRKGYLRHVPGVYKTFRNQAEERPEVEMKGEQPKTIPVDGVETSAVHM